MRSICRELTERDSGSTRDIWPPVRALVVGGPGSGKSTGATMVAQLLRYELVRSHLEVVPAQLQARLRHVVQGLAELSERIKANVGGPFFPLRVSLPELSRWSASRDSDDQTALLWRFLAGRATEHAALCGLSLEISAAALEELVGAHDAVLWIFDGLDEVPRSAGRDLIVALIRSAMRYHHGVVVTTRPQGYEGELGDLDSLVLTAMPAELALDYGKRLLRAWSAGEDPQLDDKLALLQAELAKPEVEALVRSPLHTTMAVLLIAEQGTLPSARHLLFEHYFDTIFKRELGKRGEHGVRMEDRSLLRALHARAGLGLHVRSQGRTGAQPTLSPRELRAILEAIYREEGCSAEDAQDVAERMLQFAADRLVLLLRVTDGGYAFAIRSLQEFFAGIALLDGHPADVKRRLQAIALSPHWSNVMGLIVSDLAVPGKGPAAKTAALEYTRGLCRALNDGTLGGRAAAVCVAGSRLALAMLRETERYGGPWLHDPLWEIALEAAEAPVQEFSAQHIGSPDGVAESLSTQWDDTLEIHIRLGALAMNWSGANRERWLKGVLDAAAALLARGELYVPVGWRLLLAGLYGEEPRALRIAEDHLPQTPAVARRALSVLGTIGIPPARWFLAFVNDHAAWFSPGWLMSINSHIPHRWSVSGVFALWERDSTPIFTVQLDPVLACMLVSVETPSSKWSLSLPSIVQDSAEWRAWDKLALFHTEPSKDRLAAALDTLAAPAAWEDARRFRNFLAWPVHGCLEFVSSANELRVLAAAARAGALGDVDDWRAAEERWRMDPQASAGDLVSWLSAEALPWTSTIASDGQIFSTRLGRSYNVQGVITREIARVCAVLSDQHTYHPRPVAWLGQLLFWLDERDVVDGEDVVRDLVTPEIVEAAPELPDQHPYRMFFAIDRLLPDLEGPSAERWFRLLDERGRRGVNRGNFVLEADWRRSRIASILKVLVGRLAARPDQWGLVDAIWVTLSSLRTGSLRGLRVPRLPEDAPARVRASAAALTLVSPEHDGAELSALVAALVSENDGLDLRPALARILTRYDGERARATSVLLCMLDATRDADESVRDVILGSLFGCLKQLSLPAFATAEAWQEHQLPAPYLSGQAPDPLPPRIANVVALSNIRLFKETPTIDAPFPTPDADQGQWIILVGENGVGKTTFLRALGLALADPIVAARLLDENQPYVRNGGDGHIAVELDTAVVEVLVRRDARTETIVPTGNDKVTRPWVVGYGVRRGNARGEKDRAPEWGPTGELHTLFDRPATLVNAVDWLLDLDRRVLNERRQYGPEPGDGRPRLHAATWQSVETALKSLLGVTAIEPAERHVMVTHPEFGRVRLDALSDGYLTTTGWVVDLIARWVQRQEDLREAIGRDLLRQMTGIVLIDEIDLHLHPIWQMHIIDDIRRLFPRLSFVVTTHNPLTLQGARPGEIFIMRRGDGGRVELTQRDIQPGHDVDRVLFEQFGIAYTFDHGTRTLLERHRALLERGAASDDAERIEVESQIAARLGRVGEVLADERGGEHDPSRPWSDEERRLLDQRARGKG